MNPVVAEVEAAIEALLAKFASSPHAFLTEEDVRSWLFRELLTQGVPEHSKSFDGFDTSPIHNEVRWYGLRSRHRGGDGNEGLEVDDLNLRSDMVILDTDDLVVRHGDVGVNSKGFGFNSFYWVIELKLRRNKMESDRRFRARIEDDVSRLAEVVSRVNRHNKHHEYAQFVVICLDKHELPIDPERNDGGIRVIYKSARAAASERT